MAIVSISCLKDKLQTIEEWELHERSMFFPASLTTNDDETAEMMGVFYLRAYNETRKIVYLCTIAKLLKPSISYGSWLYRNPAPSESMENGVPNRAEIFQ